MKICRYCGSAVPKGTYVCPHCGANEFDHRCPQCGTLFSSRCCPQCGLPEDAEQHKCPNCGTRFFTNACPNCGYIPYVTRSRYAEPVRSAADGLSGTAADAVSPRSRTVALILWFFLGMFGVHRFYVGKIGSGILYLCTVGLFGLGWFVDLFLLLSGTFRDRYDMPVLRWEI